MAQLAASIFFAAAFVTGFATLLVMLAGERTAILAALRGEAIPPRSARCPRATVRRSRPQPRAHPASPIRLRAAA